MAKVPLDLLAKSTEMWVAMNPDAGFFLWTYHRGGYGKVGSFRAKFTKDKKRAIRA